MWLLNVETKRLEHVVDERSHKYAILSHTWNEEEVTFQDVQGAIDKYSAKKGFRKIELTCEQAKKDGFRYAWVDTCCIDKLSSAELSEAISSMYRYYNDAETCYAFLADAVKDELVLSKCRWFTRGWTLQELIAPKDIKFYDRDWSLLGTKRTLCQTLADITGISPGVLLPHLSRQYLDTFSVATRMSWAAGRQTARVEDRAYSLQGIFNVNIPLLYGEGLKAFTRLQEEIVRTSTDQSIFAWEPTPKSGSHESSILASSPDDFRETINLVESRSRNSYHLSNRGLEISLPLIERREPGLRGFVIYGILACRYGDSFVGPVALRLNDAHDARNEAADKTDSLEFIIDTQCPSRTKVVPLEVAECARTKPITLLTGTFRPGGTTLGQREIQPKVLIHTHDGFVGLSPHNFRKLPQNAWTEELFRPFNNPWSNPTGGIAFFNSPRSVSSPMAEFKDPIVLAFEVSSDMCKVVLSDSKNPNWYNYNKDLGIQRCALDEVIFPSVTSERATKEFRNAGQIFAIAKRTIRMGEVVWIISISDLGYRSPVLSNEPVGRLGKRKRKYERHDE